MFIQEFANRGFLYQCTDLEKLTQLMTNQKITAYIGFDCTARSLHVGSLMQIMILRLLQQYGHKPIVIIGGATSKIGDPTGKDQARKSLTKEEIAENAKGIKKSLSKFITFGIGDSDAILVDNADWLESLNYLDFLSSFGSFASVNRMLSMDSVKLRLEREQHMSFLEFNYMLLQAYDFYHLNKVHDCSVQIGGSDQWGNIVMGVDLTRKLTGKEVFGITTPLITTASGGKMGKSVGGAVWLNEDMLSPYDYYQYWRNCDDLDVIKFAKIFGEMSPDKMQELSSLVESDINSAKKQLAFNLTTLCHGTEEAEKALQTTINIFEKGAFDPNIPKAFILTSKLEAGISITEFLYEISLVDSKSEAKRLVEGGGIKINHALIEDVKHIIDDSMLGKYGIELSIGKRKHFLVQDGTELMIAIYLNKIDKVKELVSLQNVNEPNSFGNTPLHVAVEDSCLFGEKAEIKQIIEILRKAEEESSKIKS